MQDENPAKLRETLQIKKFDMEKQEQPLVPDTVTVSDKFYTKDRVLVSSSTFDMPGWLGGWSLYNVRLQIVAGITNGVMYPPGVPRRSKVAIIGSQREYIPESPLNSDEWEVWGCNSLWFKARDKQDRFRADRWFELHPMAVQTEKETQAIHECPIPIYLLHSEVPEPVKNGVTFPLQWVKQQTKYPFDFYACTFAYQVALAIAEGFQEIGIFGTELMFGTPRERLFELRSLEFWLGLAMGKGIAVHFHPRSRLCRLPYLYGYDYDDEMEYCDQKTQLLSFMKGNHATMTEDEARRWYQTEMANEQEDFFGGQVADDKN